MIRDLNDTLVFVRVVRLGSFTAAAHALQIPKTTVSRRVRELEQAIGVQLLRRTTRQLSLTEAGAVYYEQCRTIADTLEHAERAVHQLRDGPRGWLRVTVPFSFGAHWFAPMLAGFRRAYPEIRLEILASHVPLDLVAEEIDVALRLGSLPDSSLIARRLASFPTGIFAAPDYLARHGQPASPEELLQHQTLILHQARRDVGYVWPLRRGGARLKDYRVEPSILANDPALLHDSLLAGEGLSLAMEQSMDADVRAGRLVRVLPEWTGPPQDLNAVTAREHLPSPKVTALIDYLKARMA
ncbi:LysR family transcriptional regulator [Pseudomonas botevensis]|uniref:LysR family transcriptional regulator n=1 Tax=Pseudomonas botevensis TaxID=2842352 RepID=UPI001C3C7332|nr:LysR family transcriptional regulator [Pseudomonas botevensis]MBV4473974.1 LysR family transcriptional regulator [Pseudomonas botevensis]